MICINFTAYRSLLFALLLLLISDVCLSNTLIVKVETESKDITSVQLSGVFECIIQLQNGQGQQEIKLNKTLMLSDVSKQRGSVYSNNNISLIIKNFKKDVPIEIVGLVTKYIDYIPTANLKYDLPLNMYNTHGFERELIGNTKIYRDDIITIRIHKSDYPKLYCGEIFLEYR